MGSMGAISWELGGVNLLGGVAQPHQNIFHGCYRRARHIRSTINPHGPPRQGRARTNLPVKPMLSSCRSLPRRLRSALSNLGL